MQSCTYKELHVFFMCVKRVVQCTFIFSRAYEDVRTKSCYHIHVRPSGLNNEHLQSFMLYGTLWM